MLEDAIHFYEHIDKHDKDNILFDSKIYNWKMIYKMTFYMFLNILNYNK